MARFGTSRFGAKTRTRPLSGCRSARAAVRATPRLRRHRPDGWRCEHHAVAARPGLSRHPPTSFEHIGMTVADDEVAVNACWARRHRVNPIGLGDVYYEAKFKSPDGLVVDVGHWAGTSPIPQVAPAQPERAYAGE